MEETLTIETIVLVRVNQNSVLTVFKGSNLLIQRPAFNILLSTGKISGHIMSNGSQNWLIRE